MSITRDQLPHLPGENDGRPVSVVNANELSDVGTNGGAFAIHEGDKIKFDGDPIVIKQPINKQPGSPVAYYVGVERNGKPSLLSISTLTRRDVDGNPLDKVRAEMLQQPSFKEMYDILRGKTIVGKTMKTFDFPVFKDGGRVEGEKVARKMCVVDYE